MFVIIWKYLVRSDVAEEFCAAYGANGEWAQLFARSPAFVGIELITAQPRGTYVTIDRWESEVAADSFLESVRDECRQLDQRLEGLTESEQFVFRDHTFQGQSQS